MNERVIIISIQGKWSNLILLKQKIIEIRKSIPICDLPITVYIYVTHSHPTKLIFDNVLQCHRQINIKDVLATDIILNGKVVAKFTLKTIREIPTKDTPQCILDDAYIERKEYESYVGSKEKSYGWVIEDLELIVPRELSSFYSMKGYEIRNAPQSWCYATISKVPSLFDRLI